MKNLVKYLSGGSIKPSVVYDQPQINKKLILDESRNKVAIYRWVNKLNGKTYIGSSAKLHIRLYKYFDLRFLSKSSRYFDRALFKHGLHNFTFEILEYTSVENLLEREQYYLDLCKPVYNIATIAGSTVGVKLSEAVLDKRKYIVLTDEVKKRKSLSTTNASIANRLAVTVTNIHTNEKINYASLTEAGKALNVSRAAVSQALICNRLIKKTYAISK